MKTWNILDVHHVAPRKETTSVLRVEIQCLQLGGSATLTVAWSRYTGFAGFIWFHVFHGVPWKLVLLVLQDFPMLFCPSCWRESGYDSKLGTPLNPWNGPMNSNSCAKDLRSCSLNQMRTFTRHSGHCFLLAPCATIQLCRLLWKILTWWW